MSDNNKKKKIMVAMSGGVDSSAAALMMKEQGWDIIGMTMRLFDPPEVEPGCKSCCSLKDAMDASTVAQRLDIGFDVIEMREEFKKEVIDRFISDYEKGLTPNPCIECNRRVKFEHLWRIAEKAGCEAMATGHYAIVDRTDPEHPVLRKSVNAQKDQSYVLYMIPKEMLRKIYFPLGVIASKDETREMVENAGLQNFRKKDSQDICFVPDGDYAAFIEHETGKEYPDGDFVSEDGTVMGRHRGLIHYTIGQRKGLGISALPEPYYVKRKDTENNRVILATNDELFSRELEANDINWIVWEELPPTIRCSAKIRYRHKEQPCTVFIDNTDTSKARVVFDEPQRAITPGQSVVFYDGDRVLGGGLIL